MNVLRFLVLLFGLRSPYFGIAANPADPPTPEAAQQRLEQARSAGVTFLEISLPLPVDTNALDGIVRTSEKYGWPVCLVLVVVDPQHKAGSLNLASIVQDFRGRIKWLILGNEVDGYFLRHPSEVPAYAQFLKQSKKFGIPLAASFTFFNIDKLSGLLKPIYDQCDFLALTYYPLNSDYSVRSPDVRADFQAIRKAAGRRKIVLQEAGYPSSPINGSSEDKQAEFVRSIRANMKAPFAAVNLFTLYDLSPKQAADLAAYYGISSLKVGSFLQSLGLLYQNGSPKKSWMSLK